MLESCHRADARRGGRGVMSARGKGAAGEGQQAPGGADLELSEDLGQKPRAHDPRALERG